MKECLPLSEIRRVYESERERESVCERERESVRGRVARKQGTLYEAMKHEIK